MGAHHRTEIDCLELLHGGYWSAAYGYRVGGRDLVARFGPLRDGYEMDRAATTFSRPDLPVPEVLAVGDAFGGSYAVSVRYRGRFLEDITIVEAPVVAGAVDRLLAALRAVPPNADGEWSWRQWLLDGLVDDPRRTVSGWRQKLAGRPDLDRLFEACAARVAGMVDACPERRDLIHGDLLHQNVLISEDLASVSAVFSWKCSVRGDFLFDVAWCTFWGSWYPGIAAIDVWARTWDAADLADPDLADAATRHYCYELRIGAEHLGWFAWTGDEEGLDACARRTSSILERGPLARPGS